MALRGSAPDDYLMAMVRSFHALQRQGRAEEATDILSMCDDLISELLEGTGEDLAGDVEEISGSGLDQEILRLAQLEPDQPDPDQYGEELRSGGRL